MKHYLTVYKEFIATAFTQASSFRLSFFLIILMDLFFYFSSLASMSFILDHVNSIGPWNREQLMFFISFMLTINWLHMTFVSESFWMFGDHIRTGSLDFLILKPIHSIFSVFFRHFRPATILNGTVAIFFLIKYGTACNLSLLSWIILPIVLLLGFALLVILEIIISVAMFWLVEGLGINFLRMQLQQLSRWPDFIYAYLTRKILTLGIPLLLIGSGPVKFLLDFKNYELLFLLIVFIAVSWYFMLLFWNIGLKKYDSPSS
jgi:ABC-2 type transport system permease protein